MGLPRSGSTLLNNILSNRSDLISFGEIHYLHPFRKDFRHFIKKYIGKIESDNDIIKLVNHIFSDDSRSGLGGTFWRSRLLKKNILKKQEIIKNIINSDMSLEAIFKVLIYAVLEGTDYKLCSIKFPVYINHIPELIRWFPNSKIIHLTRDPRAIAVSKANDSRGVNRLKNNFPYLTETINKLISLFISIQYIWSSLLHQKYLGLSNYKLIKYEDLILQPDFLIKSLCEFIEIDYHPSMTNLEKSKKINQISSLTKNRIRKIDPRRGIHWASAISNFDQLFITFMTKRSMRRFGYYPEEHPIFQLTL